jgi:hypothetical protein
MIVHDRNPGHGDEPKEPITFESIREITFGESALADVEYARRHHVEVFRAQPTRLTIGADMIGRIVAELQDVCPDITPDALPDSTVNGMTVAFDFSMNGIKVE